MKLKFILNNKLLIVFMAVLSLSLLFCGAEDPPAPVDPVISGVDKIVLQLPAHTATNISPASNFQYSAPSNVKTMVLVLVSCATGCDDGTIVSNNTVDLSYTSIVAGSSTNINMTTNTIAINQLYTLNASRNAFTTTLYAGTNGIQYKWLILGYDGAQIVAASPMWYFTPNASW